MPDLKQVLNDEIRRLARKELKIALPPLVDQITALKRQVAEQAKIIARLQSAASAPYVESTADTPAEPETDAPATRNVRITPERIIKLRQKLGLTQGQLAKILNVSNFSVSHWELGKGAPRAASKQALARLRDMGKREFSRLLQESGVVASGDAEAAGSPAEA